MNQADPLPSEELAMIEGALLGEDYTSARLLATVRELQSFVEHLQNTRPDGHRESIEDWREWRRGNAFYRELREGEA